MVIYPVKWSLRLLLVLRPDALTAVPAIIDGGSERGSRSPPSLGEEPAEFPTVVDAQVTVGEAAKWYSIIDDRRISVVPTGDLEVAPGFSIDRVWWTGSDFRLNRNPSGAEPGWSR